MQAREAKSGVDGHKTGGPSVSLCRRRRVLISTSSAMAALQTTRVAARCMTELFASAKHGAFALSYRARSRDRGSSPRLFCGAAGRPLPFTLLTLKNSSTDFSIVPPIVRARGRVALPCRVRVGVRRNSRRARCVRAVGVGSAARARVCVGRSSVGVAEDYPLIRISRAYDTHRPPADDPGTNKLRTLVVRPREHSAHIVSGCTLHVGDSAADASLHNTCPKGFTRPPRT